MTYGVAGLTPLHSPAISRSASPSSMLNGGELRARSYVAAGSADVASSVHSSELMRTQVARVGASISGCSSRE